MDTEFWSLLSPDNEHFPKHLGLNLQFQKTETQFVDERTMIKITLMSSCHWKGLVHFCLRKKKHGNALLTLTVNYRKIVQKNTL